MLVNSGYYSLSLPAQVSTIKVVGKEAPVSVENRNGAELKRPMAELLQAYYQKNARVLFSGKSKLDQFKALPEAEKQQLLNAFAYLLKQEKNVCLAVLGEKPAAYTSLDNQYFQPLLKHKSLLESETIKIVVEPRKYQAGQSYKRLFIINLPALKETVNQHHKYLGYRLNLVNATPEDIVKKLTGPNSPLFDLNNNHDLIGICLGFPFADNLMFKAYSDIDDMLAFLKAKGQEDSNQARTLKTMVSMARPDLMRHMKAYSDKMNEVLKIMEIKKPVVSFPQTHFYRFVTWDRQSPEMGELKKIIDKNTPVVAKLFEEPQDLLEYFLKKA